MIMGNGRRFCWRAESGTTLLEVVVAVGILGAVVAVVTSLSVHTQQASQAAQARQTLRLEIDAFSRNLNRYFSERQSPTTVNGYKLTAGGSALSISRANDLNYNNAAATTSFTSTCIAVPAGAPLQTTDKSTLASLARFSCGTGNCPVCLRCDLGKMPVVQFTNSDNGLQSVIPKQTTGTSNRPLAAGMCVQQLAPSGGSAGDLVVNLSLAIVQQGKPLVVQSQVLHLSSAMGDQNVTILH